MNEVEDKKISGKKFAALRDSLNFTQQEFAVMLEMSVSNLRRIEYAGATKIRPKSLRKLAEIRKIDAAAVLKELSPDPADRVMRIGPDEIAGTKPTKRAAKKAQ